MDQNELLQVAKENRTMLDVLGLKQELSGEISKLTERVQALEDSVHHLWIKGILDHHCHHQRGQDGPVMVEPDFTEGSPCRSCESIGQDKAST